MKDDDNTSFEITQLIHKPPGNWRNFSQALIDASGNGILAVDHNGIIFLANKAALDRFGVKVGISLEAALPQIWPMVAETLANGQHRMEISVYVGDNEYLVRVSPIVLDRELVGAICACEESGELEKVGRQMRSFREMTRELDAIIDSSSDGLFVCDAQANVIRINPASERIHKVKAQQVIGRNMVELIQSGFIDRSAALEVSRSKKAVSLLQTKDNRKLISTGTPVFDDQSNLIRVVVSERDITEIDTLQRMLEEQEALKDQFRNQIMEMQQADRQARRIIARSPSMVKALQQALKVSRVNSSVLITGESGVGKGLIADLIHKNSGRSDKPLIKINCGAIPESLIESELFGYDKGAFTGAQTSGKPGYLELADGGTLLLDEIAELPLSAQVKLLRFLEDGRITRLGGTQARTVDARIIAATHRNLKEMVIEETFRRDLYYRLNVIPLNVPAVRDRKDCILPLIRYYIDYFAAKNNTRKRLTRAAIDGLMAYPYPGNVRELMNICERTVVMSETGVIDLQDLPAGILERTEQMDMASAHWHGSMTLKQILMSVERSVLLQSIDKCKSQCEMAAMLGVSQPTITRRLKKHGLAMFPIRPSHS